MNTRIFLAAVVSLLLIICSSVSTMTAFASSSPENSPSYTMITIDGNPDDWEDRSVLLEDPAGDNAEGFLDFRNAYAFVNQNALYIMVEVEDTSAQFQLFDIHFAVDDTMLQITYDPRNTGTQKIYSLSGNGSFTIADHSEFAYNQVFEARIDLRDFNNPISVSLVNFMAMENIPSIGWSACDSFQPPITPVVDEKDIGQLILDESIQPSTGPVSDEGDSSNTVVDDGPLYTHITIDGNPDDWTDRTVLLDDPAGDNAEGFLDLRNAYAFVNQNALYIMVEVEDVSAKFQLFDILFAVDDTMLQITYDPRNTGTQQIQNLSGNGPFGFADNSRFAYNQVFEARIDLRDFKNPTSVSLVNFMAMENIPSIGWSACDSFQPPTTPIVSEKDTGKAMLDDRYRYAKLWGLHDTFVGEALWLSPIGNNGGIAISENGTVYLKIWGSEAGVSTLNPDTGEVTSLLHISPTTGTSDILGGPGDTAYMNVATEVWQIYPDGWHTTWGRFPNEFIVAYSPDGRMFGKSHSGSSLYELFRNGSKKLIAEGLHNIYDALVTEDGIIVVYEWNTGDVVRINPDGSKKILVHSVMPGDFANLKLDFDGQMYLISAGTYGFKRVNIDTGELTDIPNAYHWSVWNPNDFVFIQPGKFILIGDECSWTDINTGTNGVLVQNIGSTFAADIGPDNALYFGVSDCGNGAAAQIRRIADDGTQSVYLDNLTGTMERIAFTPDGNLYILTQENGEYHLLFASQSTDAITEIAGVPQDDLIMSIAVDPDTCHVFLSQTRGRPILEFDMNGLVKTYKVEVPWSAHEFKMDFAPDGSLYAYVGRDDGPTNGPWVVSVDLDELCCKEIAELPREPAGAGLGAFSVSPDGNLWVYLNPESIIYQITPEGEMSVFARHLPIDAPAIVAGQSESIYFTCSSGLFHIYREQ